MSTVSANVPPEESTAQQETEVKQSSPLYPGAEEGPKTCPHTVGNDKASGEMVNAYNTKTLMVVVKPTTN